MIEEQEGIKAIIALQKIAGIDEPEEKARKNWRSFSERNKETTMAAYQVLFGGGDKESGL